MTSSGTTGGNYGTDSSYGTSGSSYSTNDGPQGVGSDLDHRANPNSSVPGNTDTGMTHKIGGVGTGTGHTTGTGMGHTSGTGMDHTTGSGMTGSAMTGGVHDNTATIPGGNAGNLAPTGPAPNTAGPHSSDIANKLDTVCIHS